MTDASISSMPAAPEHPKRVSLMEPDARTQKRKTAERRFRMYGIAAIATGIFFLIVLLVSIVSSGTGAFQQTFINASIYLLSLIHI